MRPLMAARAEPSSAWLRKLEPLAPILRLPNTSSLAEPNTTQRFSACLEIVLRIGNVSGATAKANYQAP